jgi:LemA protein
MLTILWILIAILILAVLIFIVYFNRFAILERRIENSLSQIDVQLKKRADLVPNLVATVKGYAKHEKGIMEKVTDARKALIGAKDIVGKMKAGNQLANAIGRIFAIAENYPQLKANENFLQLQQELAAIEDKVAYARQYYSDSILSYNTLCTTLPGAFFANLYSRKQKEFFKIPEAQRALPKVEF